MTPAAEQLTQALRAVAAWEAAWGPFAHHPSLAVDEARWQAAFEAYAQRLRENYPFFHPRYAGQMLKPPHPAAVVGYVTALLINPNNHALDGGPATGQMEKEVVPQFAAMFGLPDDALGHLTSSGTIANLEALWVARETHPGRVVAFSEDAHYTHARMCQVLGVPTVVVPADADGRMRPEALEELLRAGTIGTVVLTAGTTGIGAVDPVADVVDLRAHYDFRIHIDAAYGGFFALLADDADAPLGEDTRRHLRAISAADSVVVDPHKHGLQPYGCGCVLFRDPAVGRFYQHDSPYTYFTADALHLGEISLECSRAGAAAGALWFTLRLLPLAPTEGLGPVLAACLRAARRWAALLKTGDALDLYTAPELDIVAFFSRPKARQLSALDEASARLFERAMAEEEDPVFLSLLRVDGNKLARRIPDLQPDRPHARILRSVLMKPEHETYVERLHERLVRLV